MLQVLTTVTCLSGATAATQLVLKPHFRFPEMIIGGTTAKRGEYKFYAAYETAAGFPFCGSTLINKNWALTAAHCNRDEPADNFRVRVSAYALAKVDPATEEVRVLSSIITYPKWDPATISHDYGLLKFNVPVDTVTPVDVFNADTFAKNPQPLTIIGLGRNEKGSSQNRPAALQQADTTFVPNKECKEQMAVDDSMICIEQKGISACHGDSGGPLFFHDDGKPKQIGIASWVSITPQGGCNTEAPNVYARLNREIIQYIEQTIEGSV